MASTELRDKLARCLQALKDGATADDDDDYGGGDDGGDDHDGAAYE